MPDMPGMAITVTKNSDNSFTWVAMMPSGSVFAQFTHPSADMTTINALSGGSSATFTYAQNSMANLSNQIYNKQ